MRRKTTEQSWREVSKSFIWLRGYVDECGTFCSDELDKLSSIAEELATKGLVGNGQQAKGQVPHSDSAETP
ncbi:hypothetical protein HWC80_gp066 [Mycobacterium phage Indlulamithi]|uniref:Uncharacterized protein n=1 Tax=Mycobacterium phage Indlulamithi TaxID=2656582 RepID=A0A649VDJ0_9CAUD|nr:hypothetical protein HWC80_gp066 [Mycobacterium phage Indlulamithi]QGJ90145.1 hypothetical protein PBI_INDLULAMITHI_108 [Mycobacterium phage Indlulamithi]